MASCLYFGKVMHRREQPVEYHFEYQTASIKVDIDEFEQESSKHRLLSFNRFNLLSVHTRDHGSRDGTPWRQWLTSLLAEYSLMEPSKIELVCYPRILGYAFNPLAMWYAYDTEGQLYAVVAEVSNTFGQWHHYVLNISHLDQAKNQTMQSVAEKIFHVSPFIDMQAHYHFKLTAPSERFYTFIQETQNNKVFFYASQDYHFAPLTTQNLLRVAGLAPIKMFKVIALIHWWALKIWLLGGKFHATPTHLKDIRHSHSEMKSC